ncbi:MAG: hypothetical protein IKM97_03355 [Clostridia bacterium]|nr:hypothetical protein [Clostridia bacterium]
MKTQKGITLISLVVTIIVIVIISTVTIFNGIETYENANIEIFIAKMKIIQEAVDKLCNEYTVQEINSMGTSAPSDAKEVLSEVIEEGANLELKYWYKDAGDEAEENYRYFSIDDISTILGIKDFDTGIFFNPRTRNVIAISGIKYDGKNYYRQYDLKGGQTLSAPNLDTDFYLDISVNTFDDKAVIYVNTDKIIKELKYQKKNETGYEDPIASLDLSKITINESGTYRVIATTNSIDSTGDVVKTSKETTITIVNKPLVVNGMIPIKYNGTNIVETTFDDEEWYNYSPSERRWANVKLLDGSIFVWIPRYAYLIESIEDNNTINIEFMKGNSSFLTTSGNILLSNYKIMPAFLNGKNTGFANGEWDSELNGIWVAKYEATSQEVNGEVYPKIVATMDEQSWRGTGNTNSACDDFTPKKMFDICRKMEELTTNTYFASNVQRASGNYNYGVFSIDDNNIDTHLMKNSEWGAVAYLSYSKYGNEKSKLEAPTNYYSGSWIGVNGYSTTNNIYGIFGISGGAYELVSSGISITDSEFNIENKSTKYSTVYQSNSENNTIYGDAIRETSGWEDCNYVYPNELFARGGNSVKSSAASTSKPGIFSYQNKNYNATNTVSFRPVLIVEY